MKTETFLYYNYKWRGVVADANAVADADADANADADVNYMLAIKISHFFLKEGWKKYDSTTSVQLNI